MSIFKGSCLCSACCYEITGATPAAMYLCHCSRCRKETGSMHGANVFFKHAELSWQSGGDNITYFQLKNTRKQRAFCNTCGSPLPWQQGQSLVVLPAGSIDDEILLDPTAHIFYASRASWEDKSHLLKRFDELPS